MDIDKIKEIDSVLSSVSLRYKDMDLTYLLRNHVISKVREKEGVGNNEIKITTAVKLRLLKNIANTAGKLFYKADNWVFSNAERRKIVNNRYVDRVASMVSEFSDSVLFIENPVLKDHVDTEDKVLSDGWFYLFSIIFAYFFYKPQDLKMSVNLKEIEDLYGIKLDVHSKAKRYIGQYIAMKYYLKLSKKPKRVFLVYPNSYSGYIKAFKENKIPVIELQHGIIYPAHPSYVCFLNNNLSVFKPDYILTYGEKDKESLIGSGHISEDRIFPVGSYALWLYKNSTDTSAYLKRILEKNIGKTFIAVSASPYDLEELYEFAKAANKHNDNLFFLIVPRLAADYHLPENDGQIILDLAKTNVYEVMKNAEVHITKTSTCALEALFFGKKSVVIEDSPGQSFFRTNYPYLTSLEYISNVEELHSVINHKSSADITDIEKVFRSDLRQNFKNFISGKDV